jgi:hypothetical protein
MTRWKRLTRFAFLSSAALVLVGAIAAGCGDSRTKVAEPGCNALGGGACVLPFPSAIYETEDSASPTGRRVDIPEGVLPKNGNGARVDPAPFNKMDGWSPNIALLMAWQGGFDPAGLVPQSDPAASLEAASPTVVVDMETGERVPHFAEKDAEAIDLGAPESEIALIIRPVVRLQPGHHYAVGVRKTLKAVGGGDLPTSHGFQAILDDKKTSDERLEKNRAAFDDIFAKLEAAGVPKTDLVVAWDFHTRSDESAESDLVEARDALLAAAGENAEDVTYTIDSDGPSDDTTNTLRIVRGTIDFPSVLTGDGGAASVLNRGANGKPAVNGTVKDEFSIVIPACASDPANLPLPMVVYGHGLIGSLAEATGGYPRKFGQLSCMAVIATEWRGMEEDDLTAIALALSDINKQDYVMEKLVQGINQFVILELVARKKWATAPEFRQDGMPLLDPTKVFYYGISQGGIFGGTFMAIDPFVTRGVLGVPAANYNFIIERSTNWQTYRVFVYNAYTDNRIEPQILLGLMQARWDLTDPITHISHITGDVKAPYHDTPPKQVLLQMAFGDAQVNNIGAELWARTAGIPVLGPALYTPFLVEVASGPLSSALTQWNEHRLPLPPEANICTEDNGTHGSLRKRDKVNEQIIHFFETGEIVDTCLSGGVEVACDCTTDEICGPAPNL